jgi:O-acetyl-ADP-ribose deacetylase (regulator of RNase III)
MKLIQGNLIEAFKKGEVNVIAHQCNVCCGMGAGIAKTIAKEFGFIEILDKGFRRESNLGRALM